MGRDRLQFVSADITRHRLSEANGHTAVDPCGMQPTGCARSLGDALKRARAARVVALLFAGLLLTGGLGCSTAQPTQPAPATTSSASAPTASSRTALESLKSAVQKKQAQRTVLVARLGALNSQFQTASKRYTSHPAGASAKRLKSKLDVIKAARDAAAQRIDALDSELETQTERYNAMLRSLTASSTQ